MSTSHDQCPLCKSAKVTLLSTVKDVEYFTSEEFYEYWGCDSCDSIYLKNPPVENLAQIYPDNYYSVKGPADNNSSLLSVLEKVKEYFDKRLFRNALGRIEGNSINCLDVGGGSGWISNLVRDSDNRVKRTTIVDINEGSRSIAEANGHVYVKGLIELLGYENEFEFVLMLNLIEHVASPRVTLNCTHKAMKSGGVLLIKTPNTASLNRRLFQHFYWGGYHAPRHWILFNKNSFIKLATDCGFLIESFRYTQGAPQWVASVLGSIERFRPNPKRRPMPINPYSALLSLVFVVFDFIRLPLFPTDQMIFMLKKK